MDSSIHLLRLRDQSFHICSTKSNAYIFLTREHIKNTLNEHKKRIQDIISSTYVESAIKKQEELNKEYTNDFSIELTGLLFSRIPNLISLFKKRVENYLAMLGEQPTSPMVSSCPEKKEKEFSDAQEDESQASEETS